MGTRADFYVGRGETAEWIGSISWDGYRTAVAAFLAERDDATLPIELWPWPWENSQTTDYAYAWDDRKVYGAGFGYSWWEVDLTAENCGEPEEAAPAQKVAFPDMSSRKGDINHIMSRSGMIVVSRPKDGE